MRRLWFLLFLLPVTAIQAQQEVITGIVKDADTKEPLVNCTITTRNGKHGTITNGSGFFSLILPAKTTATHLVIVYAGYKNDTVSLATVKKQLLVLLHPLQDVLNEVMVTGVSRKTLLRENPIAVASVSAKMIDKTIEPNIIDALVKNVPGLNAVKTGPNISKPFIRGLGYNRVLTLYDGIRQEGQQWGDEHGIEVDAYNIEKAEVIKGPASLMFGSDALAGVVSLFPYLYKEKDGLVHGKILSEFQSNNGLWGNGFRIGYSNTHWLWLVKGSYRVAKNYSNRIDGRVYNTGFIEKNIAATVGYTTPQGYSNLNATVYDNLQGIPDGSRDSATRKFTKQVHEGAMDDLNNRPYVTEAELNGYQLSPLHQHIQHYRLYTNNHYRTAIGEIDVTAGFQQNIRREYSHPSVPQQAGLFVRLNTINYGLKYIAPVFSSFDITIGVNGMYQDNKSRAATDFPVPNYILFDAGTYLFGKWKHNQLTVSGGLRYDIRTVNGAAFYTATDVLTGFHKQVNLPDTAGSMLQFTALHKAFSGVSLSMGIAYQFSEQISLKANIARGYRSPNITELASNGLDPGAHIIYLGNRGFVPEFSFQQDLGLAFTNKMISSSISIFNNNIQGYIFLTQLADAQGNAVMDAQGNRTFQYQQGSARLYGAEASFDIHPPLWKGFTFNNSFSVVYGTNDQHEYKDKGTEGEYLPLIPPAKLISNIIQDLAISSAVIHSLNIKAEVEYCGAQNRVLSLYNTETATPAYALVNLASGINIYGFKKQLVQLLVQVNNVFDLAYQSNISRLKYFEYYTRSAGTPSGIYGMGRNFCMKMIIPF